MYIKYEDLKSAIEVQDPRIKNYFDTFGFVVIKDVLDKSEFKNLLKEYDKQYALRTNSPTLSEMVKNRIGLSGEKRFGVRAIWNKYGPKEIIKKILRRGGMRFLPNFVDGSETYFEHYFSQKYMEMYDYFAGKNWLYLGSDGSNFITTSFPWHRDWYTKIPLLKFNFYYNPLPFIGGNFLIIPGSNFTDDSYAQMIQKSMAWPMQNKYVGGLSENNRLPEMRNPRDIFNLTQTKADVPHVKIKVGRGDVVLFDHRCVHCVENSFPQFQRRLMTILIGKNAYDMSDNHFLVKKHGREALMRELVDLVVNERNHIGCDPYGDALLSSSFPSSNHYIKISKNKSSEKFNVGQFKLNDGTLKSYQLDFDRYASVGRNYRQKIESDGTGSGPKHSGAENFSYQDVHLGINAQNIHEFHES